MNYRDEARLRVERCRSELESGDDERLKYAALELRMAMEALTYDRAVAYKDEFPPSEYETWQPRKVMRVLLEIDSFADSNSSIAIGHEKEYGVRPETMRSIGSENVLNAASLKKHYDALGNHLHIPSMKQIRLGKQVNTGKFRKRCEEILAILQVALSSPVFNITLGNFSTLQCIECRKPIRKRVPAGQTEWQTECFECKATYTVKNMGGGQFAWDPNQTEIECPNESCSRTFALWQHELRVGGWWQCSECGGRYGLALAIQPEPQVSTDSSN